MLSFQRPGVGRHRARSVTTGGRGLGVYVLFPPAVRLETRKGPLFAWLVRYGRYLTLLALGLIWLWRARREPVSESVLTILVAFFAVTHAFPIQYLMWVCLLLFWLGTVTRQWLFRYTLAVFCYMFLTYATLILTSAITRWLP